MMLEVVALIGFALFVAAAGIALGMLVAPIVGRLGERGDADDHEEDDDGG